MMGKFLLGVIACLLNQRGSSEIPCFSFLLEKETFGWKTQDQ